MTDIDKKYEILQAARKIFAHYGYDKTTLDDIGRLTGLNKTSLYYYYENKESIFVDVIKSEINEFLTETMIKINDIDGCKNKITTFIKDIFENSERTININKLGIILFQKIKPVFQELFNELLSKQAGYIAIILEESFKKGELVQCDVNRIADAVVNVIQAIKSKNCSLAEYGIKTDVDFSKTAEEVIFTVSLILDGIMKK